MHRKNRPRGRWIGLNVAGFTAKTPKQRPQVSVAGKARTARQAGATAALRTVELLPCTGESHPPATSRAVRAYPGDGRGLRQKIKVPVGYYLIHPRFFIQVGYYPASSPVLRPPTLPYLTFLSSLLSSFPLVHLLPYLSILQHKDRLRSPSTLHLRCIGQELRVDFTSTT